MVTIEPDASSKNGSKCIERCRCQRDRIGFIRRLKLSYQISKQVFKSFSERLTWGENEKPANEDAFELI